MKHRMNIRTHENHFCLASFRGCVWTLSVSLRDFITEVHEDRQHCYVEDMNGPKAKSR